MPKIRELEKRLGFKWEDGMSTNMWKVNQIPVVKAFLEDIKRLKKDFAAFKPKALLASKAFHERQQDLLFRHANDLWPLHPVDTSSWLVDANVNNWNGLYPKNLAWRNTEDQDRLCKYFNQLLFEKCIHNTALDTAATIQSSTILPQGSETAPVAQMLPLSDEIPVSRLLDSTKDREGEKDFDRRVPTPLMKGTIDLSAPVDDVAHWTTFGRLPTAKLVQMLPEAGEHNGLVHSSSGQKRAASFELEKEAAFAGDERSTKQQKVYDSNIMRSRVVRLKLTAEKLRKLDPAFAGATCTGSQRLHLGVPQTHHHSDAGFESGHPQNIQPMIGDSYSDSNNASDVSIDPVTAKRNTTVFANNMVGVEGAADNDRCENQTSSNSTTKRHASNQPVRTSIPRQDWIADAVDHSGSIPGPSQIKSLTTQPNSPFLMSEKTIRDIGIGVTGQAASRVQDLKTGETKVIIGEDNHERYSMTPSATEPQSNVERGDEAPDKSKIKMRMQTTPSTTIDDARTQTAEASSHATTIQGAILSLELRLQGSHFQQFITIDLSTSLNDFFSSIQKRMSRRLAGNAIQCLKLWLPCRSEQRNAYMIEKDDADTWEKFRDDAQATAVEGEKTKGIAEAEVD